MGTMGSRLPRVASTGTLIRGSLSSIPVQGRSESTSDSGHLLIGHGGPPRPLSMSCVQRNCAQPLAVAWGRQARAASQPRRNLVLLGVLAESRDQLVLAHGRAAFDLQLTSPVEIRRAHVRTSVTD